MSSGLVNEKRNVVQISNLVKSFSIHAIVIRDVCFWIIKGRAAYGVDHRGQLTCHNIYVAHDMAFAHCTVIM